ncbi:hypothetical protein B7463_g7437, partial [Scytalidium lignicola]
MPINEKQPKGLLIDQPTNSRDFQKVQGDSSLHNYNSNEPQIFDLQSLSIPPIADKNEGLPNSSIDMDPYYQHTIRYINIPHIIGLAYYPIPQSTTIHYAVANGTLEQVERLIASGVQIDSRDEDNKTPLHIAVLKGRAHIVEALIIKLLYNTSGIQSPTGISIAREVFPLFLEKVGGVIEGAAFAQPYLDPESKSSRAVTFSCLFHFLLAGANPKELVRGMPLLNFCLRYMVFHEEPSLWLVDHLLKTANVNSADSDGNFPLHSLLLNNSYHTSRDSKFEFLDLLICNMTISVDQPNNEGEYPLELLLRATAGEDYMSSITLQCVQRLVDSGAKPTRLTSSGRTVFDFLWPAVKPGLPVFTDLLDILLRGDVINQTTEDDKKTTAPWAFLWRDAWKPDSWLEAKQEMKTLHGCSSTPPHRPFYECTFRLIAEKHLQARGCGAVNWYLCVQALALDTGTYSLNWNSIILAKVWAIQLAAAYSILLSRPITFLVGVDEVSFLVHEAALVHQSLALAGRLGSRSNESIIVWRDVEQETFTRFIQFAYTGDYSVPTMIVQEETSNGIFIEPPHVMESAPSPELEPPSTPNGDTASPIDYGFGWVSARKKKNRSRPKLIYPDSEPDPSSPPKPIDIFAEPPIEPPANEIEGDSPYPYPYLSPTKKKGLKLKMKRSINFPKSFSSLSYSILRPRNNFENTCDPRVETGSDENIGEVLRLHASLYILAYRWEVETLKTLSLLKLHQTLGMLRLDASKVQHMVDLVQYVYSDGSTVDLAKGIDDLRLLICLYIADNSQLTSENEGFTTLLEEGGAFPRDLWRLTASRISQE